MDITPKCNETSTRATQAPPANLKSPFNALRKASPDKLQERFGPIELPTASPQELTTSSHLIPWSGRSASLWSLQGGFTHGPMQRSGSEGSPSSAGIITDSCRSHAVAPLA